jgi:hypothetical protein
MQYKVILSTVASITVDAKTEDDAIDKAYERAHQFGDQDHSGHGYSVDINNEWQYEEPTVERVAEEV